MKGTHDMDAKPCFMVGMLLIGCEHDSPEEYARSWDHITCAPGDAEDAAQEMIDRGFEIVVKSTWSENSWRSQVEGDTVYLRSTWNCEPEEDRSIIWHELIHVRQKDDGWIAGDDWRWAREIQAVRQTAIIKAQEGTSIGEHIDWEARIGMESRGLYGYEDMTREALADGWDTCHLPDRPSL